MGSPHRVRFIKQLDGSRYQGLNCNCAAAAMALDRHTIGADRTTGARVRALTGDTSGGTTLPQVAAALYRGWGISLTVKTPCSIAYFDNELHDGHGAILQGSSSATRGTRYSASSTFAGNHSWWVNEGRGWKLVNGAWVPTEYLVFDPLADGRRSGIAKSPFWLPRSYLLTFARRLDLNGRGSLIGAGRAYAAFTRDTEPHVHLKYGAVKTSPFPDRTRGDRPGARINIYPRPDHKNYKPIATIADNALFVAYQRTTRGSSYQGSTLWYGNHDGTKWIHSKRLSHEGGST